MRPAVSQQRLEIDDKLAKVRLRPKARADDTATEEQIEALDPDEAVARGWDVQASNLYFGRS